MGNLRYKQGDNLSVHHYSTCNYDKTHKKILDRPQVKLDSDQGPFYGISNGLTGSTYNDVWNAIKTLYSNNTYDIICDAFSTMDLRALCKHPKFKNETPASLQALIGSFMTTERIERTGHLTDKTVGILFKFISTYRTFGNDTIKLVVPTIVQYKPEISWYVLNPSFYIGGDSK